jgi:hypothetical protein
MLEEGKGEKGDRREGGHAEHNHACSESQSFI